MATGGFWGYRPEALVRLYVLISISITTYGPVKAPGADFHFYPVLMVSYCTVIYPPLPLINA
jgi:hypothetical protein